MRRTSALIFAALVGFSFGGCSNTALDSIGADVLSSTGYVSSSQASGLFSAGRKAVKSQEALTPEQEYYLGRAVSAKVLNTFPPVLDAGKTTYVNEVGMTLAGVSDTPETFGGYHFAIVDSPTINAMSAPGGFIYVSSGFLKVLPDEDSLAAVLAHEIAHIVGQDGVNAVSNAALFSALSEASTQGASIAATNAGAPELGALTDIFSESVTGVVDKLLTKGFDRSQEYQADLYAAQLMQRAGYDPSALVRVLRILESQSGNDSQGWFATHPNASDRIEELQDDFAFNAAVTPAEVRSARYRKLFGR